ncbi:MAG: OsmC family protein [Acidobacteria bacterium]|nr:OsmC family protein [Acidobacteriota bacterium]
MNARVTWIGGNAFAGQSGSGHWAVMDAPDGETPQAAPTPMEYLLLGLCGCTGVDVRTILQKMRQDVRGITVDAEVERASEHPRVFTKIALRYTVSGRNLDPKKVHKAVALSHEKYCSASAMLGKTAEITREIEIKDER